MTKQQQMILGATLGVLVLGGGGYMLLNRPPAEDPAAAGTTAATPATGTAQGPAGDREPTQFTPPASAAGTPPGAGSDPFRGGPGATAARPGAPGTPGAAATASATPAFRAANDPFFVTWKVKPPPPLVFDSVQPIRIASANIVAPPPPNTEVREVPQRRVSGIMSGEGVFAILEGMGEPEIVRPGSTTSDGFTVVAINADSVKLQKKEGNLIRTQIVKLTDVPVGGAQTAFFPGGGRPNFGPPSGIGGGFPGGGRGRFAPGADLE